VSSFVRAWYVLVVLGLITFAFMAFVGRAPASFTAYVGAPGELPNRVGAALRQTGTSLVDRRDHRAEIDRLEDALADARQQVRLLEIDNERLAALAQAQFRQSPGAEQVVAVSRGFVGQASRYLELAAGRAAGVQPLMPATAPDGLVGLVTDVTDRRSVVRSIMDPESRVGVTVRGKGGQGVAVGALGPNLRVVRFIQDADVQVGDVVETSSIGGLFPRGIEVGRVVELDPVDPNDVRRSFAVRPSVTFGTLLDVTLVAPQ
jgi:rod shape-determining protein MreC